MRNIIPRIYVCQKLRLKLFENMNGIKNNNDNGIAKSILLANNNVFSTLLCSKYEKIIAIMLTRGKQIINPDRTGFLIESQLTNDMIREEINVLRMNIIIL